MLQRLRTWLRLIAATALMALSLHTPVWAQDSASTVVRNFYTQLSSAIQQGDHLGFAGRYKKLDPAIREAFNLPLMAKISVGSNWSIASPQQQNELVEAFSDFSIASYASQFARDDGEKFTVLSEKPAPDGSVTVETQLLPKKGDAVPMNYLLRQDDHGKYRIVDVYLNGTISQLAARRAEFSTIARRDGIAGLVNSLDQKSKQMDPSPAGS